MSFLDIIAIVVLVLSLIGIGFIVFRKFPLLASIDVKATTSPTSERKVTILEQRLKRKFQTAFTKVGSVSQPVWQRTGGLMKKAQHKLVDLEHEYKARSLPVWLNRRQRQKVANEVGELLDQARLLIEDEEYRAAEEKALQAVRLDPRSVPAFELLGEIYMETKEFTHAKEVYSYLLKLSGDSDAMYEKMAEADMADGNLAAAEIDLKQAIALNSSSMLYHLELAQIERQLGHWEDAFSAIQAAAQLEPNHPKVLDELIEVSLGAGKREYAKDAIAKIKSTNPDNKKIPEWEERLATLS